MQLLRLSDVCARVGLKRSSIYRLLDAGGFPRPVELGTRARGWVPEEIDAWIQAKIEARDRAAA